MREEHGGAPKGQAEGHRPDPSAREMDVLERITRANLVVSELCDGTRRWTMSIPVRPDDDADIVIGRALHESTKEITSLRAQLAAAEGQARGSEAMLIQAQRDCDNAQNAELVALSQLAEMTTLRDKLAYAERTIEQRNEWINKITRMASDMERERDAALSLLAERDAQVGHVKALEELVASEPLTYQVSGMCDNDGTVRWILHAWGVSGNIEAPTLAALGAALSGVPKEQAEASTSGRDALATGPRATEETT